MPSDTASLERFLSFYKSIEYIRFQWIDYSGVLRASSPSIVAFELHLLHEEMRVEYGMDKRMPVTFKEALESLKKDADLKAWIRQDLLRWFISAKDKEVEEFAMISDEQRRRRFL